MCVCVCVCVCVYVCVCVSVCVCFHSIAQMDMTKSTGYRAVEELLKAQATHTTLRRQFEGARVNEITLAKREVSSGEYEHFVHRNNNIMNVWCNI